jgi:hypothetical protein
MWALTKNEYAVLSTYVSDAATMKDNMPGKRGTNNMVRMILIILYEIVLLLFDLIRIIRLCNTL